MQLIKPVIILVALSSCIIPVNSMQMSLQAGMQQETKARSTEEQEKLNQSLWQALDKDFLASKDYPQIAEAIQNGADVNAKKIFKNWKLFPKAGWDQFQLTPLICSAGRGNLKVVERLIESGADINATDSLQETALHAALSYAISDKSQLTRSGGNRTHPLPLIQLLISAGANVNAIDNEGETPLHKAASYYAKYGECSIAPEIIQELILAGAHFGEKPALNSIQDIVSKIKKAIKDDLAQVHLLKGPATIISEYLLGNISPNVDKCDENDSFAQQFTI